MRGSSGYSSATGAGLDADYDSHGGDDRASSVGSYDDDLSVDLERGLRGSKARRSWTARIKGLFRAQRWKYPTFVEARVLSWASIIWTTITGVAGVALAVSGNSAALLAFALEALVDLCTSGVILWRFGGADPLTMAAREDRSAVVIGLSFLVLGVVTVGAAIVHLASYQKLLDTSSMLALTIPSFFISAFLGVLKIHVSKVLNSQALKEDGICSLGSSALSLGAILGIASYEANSNVWWVDSLIAILVGVAVFLYGFSSLRNYKWRTKEFWFPQPSQQAENQLSTSGFERVLDQRPLDIDNI